jgi:hypothetical protein
MKKNLFLAWLLFVVIVSLNAQSSLDSLRLVVPVGHTDGIYNAVFSKNGN